MPVPTFTGLKPDPNFEDVVRKINTLVNELTDLMLNLDDVNFDKITANILDVNELSAITANLGHITAGKLDAVEINSATIIAGIIIGAFISGGTILGSQIKTAETGQRIEFSSLENLIKAVNAEGNVLSLLATVTDSPALQWNNGTDNVEMWLIPGSFSINTTESDTNIAISAGGHVNLSPGPGRSINVPSFNSIYGQGDFTTLGSYLSMLDARITALENA